MHAVGRVGAIGSGVLGGVLLSLGWTLEQIFLALAGAMLIGGLAMAFMGIWVRVAVTPHSNSVSSASPDE
jgi:AAHS family 4-hydroxybenzoate transporter-like MFS transporter